MHRLVPEFIQERFAEEETAGSFSAGVLFVDISGFTSMAEALMSYGQDGAEALAQLIKDVFDPLVQSVFEQGGFVTNLAGDAFTAVFSAKNVSPDSYARTLAAAWKIQRIVADSTQHQTPYGTFAVSVKVGMAAGEIAWGILSSTDQHRAAYYFQGPAVDGCAQAEKLAQSGDIIVDAAAFNALGSMISAIPIADHFRITAINVALPEPQAFHPRSVDPDIVRRFFPSEALQQTRSGEFRQVVSMFVSLPTVRTVNQLRIFMQTVFNLQDRYGGFLNRLDFGDKGANLLLFWGAPLTYENDVTRALTFILDLQSQTAIPVIAGITYGIAHTGYSGGTWAGEYTCHGRGISLAARMMQTAPRGEIWMDENVAARAQNQFEVEFEAEMAFKGFAQKQRVFVLLERKEAPERIYSSEMIGRLGELKRLTDFLQPLWMRQYPGAMFIWGEAGIGKSRLVHGFLQHLESTTDHSFSVFVCQTDEILREPLNPFLYWLRTYFGQSRQHSDARNKRSFNRKLDHLIASTDDETLVWELDRTRSFLGAMVNLYWPDSLYEQLDAKGRYENSFIGLISLLKAESLQQPAILFLEDLQWLDEDSQDFLVQLERALTQGPPHSIAVIATARPEANRALSKDFHRLHEINLGQMTISDLAMLAAEQLSASIGSQLLELLTRRADGNPFFAEQILRYLQEQHLIVRVDGEWRLQTRESEALPENVSAILVARLDRLTKEVKEVVQMASVLGREFEIRLLAHMRHDDPAIREEVAEAERASIWSALNELRYLFNHALLRDAAYRMQVRARRELLHRLAAEALEDLHDNDLSLHYGELAYHTEQAGLFDKTRRYLELAGEIAADAYHNSQAVDYFSRALILTPAAELDSRYRLLRAREDVYKRLGERQAQEVDLSGMSELADRLKDASKQVEVRIRRAWLSYWTSDFATMLEWAQHAAILAEAAGEYGLAGQAHYAMSWALVQQGVHDAARHQAKAALAAARQSGDLRGEGNGHNVLGLISMAEGDYFQARGHLKEFLVLAHKIQDRERESIALVNLGVVSVPLGDYEAAQDYSEQFLDIAREMGDRSSIGTAYVNLSWVAATQGNWGVAIEYGELAVAMKQESKQIDAEAEGLLWLGHAWLGLGRPVKALAAYEKSLQARRELGQDHLAMGVLAGMARVALAQQDLDSASGYVTEILSYLDSGGSLDGTWEPLRIYLTCYQVLQALQDSRADTILEIAYRRLQQQAKTILDSDIRRMFLEHVPWHREIVAAHHDMISRS